ncbi:MAG: formylglycine-generating enzyme family protein, partial [Wenzhouxiangella sp.]|nr:formylglycine-generating enzyme family protein [Wenzhouxiangella sp.]
MERPVPGLERIRGLAEDLLDAGLSEVGGTIDEPTGEVSLPVDQGLSCPGFYVLRTHPGMDSRKGRIGAEVLLGGRGFRTLQGGLGFGGQATLSVRGFAAFSIANGNNEDQVVNLGLDAAASGRLVMERRSDDGTTIILDLAVGSGQSNVSVRVSPGFYVLGYQPDRPDPTTYSIAALTTYAERPGGGFQGGAVFGGYHDPSRDSTGFAGFCLADPFDVSIRVLSAPTYGSSGARGLAFSVSSGEGTVFLDSRAEDGQGPDPNGTFKDCPDCPSMVVIPGGTFTQGAPVTELASKDDERPLREVSVPSFAIGQTEVTFDQWDACFDDGGCSRYPSDGPWGRGDRPVIDVSWNDAQEYVAWLSNRTGEDYRLPSESEWEYAARAGTTGRFNTGDCINSDQANFIGSLPGTGCPEGVYRLETEPVGSFAPNFFGLYDTHGNVWEWVQDCSNPNYIGAPTDGSAWMTGDCNLAVRRGGSWATDGQGLRSANRDLWATRDRRHNTYG